MYLFLKHIFTVQYCHLSSQQKLVWEEVLLQDWVSGDNTGLRKKHRKRESTNTTQLSNSCFKKRKAEHHLVKTGVTLGLLLATWTLTFHLTYDLMNSTEKSEKDFFLWDVYTDSLNAGFHQLLENEVQRPHVLPLWQAIQNWRKYLSVLMKRVSKD